MVNNFDRITLAVPDLPSAIEEYRTLLGLEPVLDQRSECDVPAAWFPLANTVLELVQADVETAGIVSLVFGTQARAAREVVANPLGLDIRLCDGASTARQRQLRGESTPARFSVDHIVLRTSSAAQCIELFEKRLGLRLALDQNVPEWGGRMLFFRAGKLTLEVIESAQDQAAADYFWGIAFYSGDLEKAAHELLADSVSLSALRKGRKPGTTVATVKSHCLAIPTLLIGPA